MDVGLGKTITSIALTRERKITKCLCVVPKSIIDVWTGEVRKFDGTSYAIATGEKTKRFDALSSNVQYVFINFEGVRICYSFLLEMAKQNVFDSMIIDELARVRRYSRQTKCLREISKFIPLKIGLTGLLVSGNLMDVFNPFFILDGGATFGVDFFKFREKYFEKEVNKDDDRYYKWVPTEYGKVMIPALVKRNAYIVTSEQAGNLPPVKFVTRKVSLSKEQLAYLTILREEWASKLPDEKEEQYSYTIQVLQKAAQCIGGFVYKEDGTTYWFNYNPKIQELNAILEEMGKAKFIVWCEYKAEKAAISNLMEVLGKKVCPSDDAVKFDSGDYDCFIGTYQKDSRGHNFKSAKYAIFFSRPTSYELFHQALGRNRRASSEHKLINYHIISSNYKTEIINDNALRKKKDLANLIREMKVNEIW